MMKKISLVILFLISTLSARSETVSQEKRLVERIEKFIVSNRKSDGDYTTISLRNWRGEMAMPPLSTEDVIRKVLDAFETHYKNLKIIGYTIGYTSKSGGGLEYDFLLIHHETKPVRVSPFATRKVVAEK